MAWNNCSILLIDADETAARELSELLMKRPEPPKLWVAASMASAEPILRTQMIEWVFIRIVQWDDYQRLRPTMIGAPKRVVFLSGRNEKCTAHLATGIGRTFAAAIPVGAPGAHLEPLDGPGICSAAAGYCCLSRAGRGSSLCGMETSGRWRWRMGDCGCRRGMRIIASAEVLLAFQERLPVTMTMVRRGCLVNERFGPGGASVRARS